MPIKNRFAEMLPEITAWRRDIHAHPELMFDTVRTGQMVAELLKSFGCDEVVTGMAENGVVAVIKGRNTASGKVVGLRADMDALPILETTGLDYASKEPGKMHACGHDGHTSMLLGAAKYLAETRNFDGTCVVIFQPAEEGGGGGDVMVREGLMDKFGIQEVFGMHNWPGMPVGTFAIRSGAFFAAADQFDIVVKGKGAHAAKPHEGVDTVLVAAQIVNAIQSIVSRNTNPNDKIVVSVTSILSDTSTHNVIPAEVTMKGTLRAINPEAQKQTISRLHAVVEGTAQTYGAEAKVNYFPGYPVMINADEQTGFAADVATNIAGSCDVADITMGGEDFAYMSAARPGAYILVGNGDTAGLHHPAYDFNDEAMPAGCTWWAEIVEKRMPVS